MGRENINRLRELVTQMDLNKFEEEHNYCDDLKDEFSDGWWSLDLTNNNEFNSDSLLKLLGYDINEENSRGSIKKLINEEDLDKIWYNLNEHFKSKGKFKYQIVINVKHKDGHYLRVLTRGKVTTWDGDKPVKMVGQIIDLSEY